MFQEQPYEVQTNYAGASALRCNFDVQDLRRVLPEKLWNLDEENNPSLRADENRSKEMGYMGVYEWDGEEYKERRGDARNREPTQWADEKTREQWREAFLAALQGADADGEYDVRTDLGRVGQPPPRGAQGRHADPGSTSDSGTM